MLILTGYSDHPSVLKINETLKISPSSFKVDDTSVADIRNAINDINLSKGGGLYDIPTKLLKMCKIISSAPVCDAYTR